MNKNLLFSYPVLSNEISSGYKEEYGFIMESVKSEVVNNNFEITIDLSITSKFLNSLIEQDKLSVYVRIYSGIFKRAFKKGLGKQTVNIPSDDLLDFDNVTINAYVLANEDFDLHWHEEMEDIYNIGEPYFINKNDVLALSNQIKFNYSLYNDSLVKLSQDLNLQNEGFIVSIKEPTYINLIVSEDLNKAYAKLRNSETYQGLVNSTLAFIAISSALIQVANEKGNNEIDLEQLTWFGILKNAFKKKGEDLDNIIDQYLNDSCDINILYRATHQLLNNNFEKQFVKAGDSRK